MSIIISSSDVGAGRIGYKNLFTTTGVTVTASTEATGYEKENAYDGVGYDFWKPTATGDSWVRVSFGAAKVANYMVIWGHDLADHGSSIKPQYSTDGGSSWTDADSAVMPSTNRTLFFTWDDINAADWRVLVTNPSTIAAIGGVMIGEVLAFPYNMEIGFSPSALAPKVSFKTAKSEGGVFLGGSKKEEGIEGSINLTNIDPVWIRDTWKPFIAYAQTPAVFAFSWDNENHADEAVTCWLKNEAKTPSYISPLYMDLSLEFEGNL